MASAKEVMKKIEDNEVKFVDLRFTDIRGKEQHITVPISHFDEDRFTDGQAFDGSSMGGWRGVQASDMLLIPDPDTAVMDPFREEPTLILTCDVVEPTEGKGYDRDPRSIARRAEAYLQSSGIGDIAYFGPEPEFFIFDSVTWKQDMSGSMVARFCHRRISPSKSKATVSKLLQTCRPRRASISVQAERPPPEVKLNTGISGLAHHDNTVSSSLYLFNTGSRASIT